VRGKSFKVSRVKHRLTNHTPIELRLLSAFVSSLNPSGAMHSMQCSVTAAATERGRTHPPDVYSFVRTEVIWLSLKATMSRSRMFKSAGGGSSWCFEVDGLNAHPSLELRTVDLCSTSSPASPVGHFPVNAVSDLYVNLDDMLL